MNDTNNQDISYNPVGAYTFEAPTVVYKMKKGS